MEYHRYYTYCIAYCISMLPSNYIRIALYRLLLGYDISFSATIGWRTSIAVEKAHIYNNVRIGRNNCFKGPFTLIIHQKASIGYKNFFECGEWATEKTDKNTYARFCSLGADSLITHEHYIDATGGFSLGNNSWIAGRSSQFWTHGLGVMERSISIGSYCYIGSAVRFAPGSALGDRCVLALGSVVTKQLHASNALVGGIPARMLRAEYTTEHTIKF